MSDLAWTVITSSLTAAVAATAWDYFRSRRSELLAAYSEWLTAFSLTSRKSRRYFFVVENFAPLQTNQQQVQRILSARLGVLTPTYDHDKAELEAHVEKMIRDSQPVRNANDEAMAAEERLTVAYNLLNMVEANKTFRDEARKLTQLLYRDLPEEETSPASQVAFGRSYVSRLDHLHGRAYALVKRVIDTHHFRGLPMEDQLLDVDLEEGWDRDSRRRRGPRGGR